MTIAFGNIGVLAERCADPGNLLVRLQGDGESYAAYFGPPTPTQIYINLGGL